MSKSFKEFLKESQEAKLERRYRIREEIENHLKEGKPLFNNHYRAYSDAFFEFIETARSLYNEGLIGIYNDFDREILESDLGKIGVYEGEYVPLDAPMINDELEEAEYQGKDVDLNKPQRGGSKKYYVYVKNDKGNVVKVEFGDSGDLKSKINDKEARKNFAARHNCDQKNDKTKPGYWSCNLPRYADQLGLSGGGNFYW